MLLVNPQALEHIAHSRGNSDVRAIPHELLELLAGKDRLLIELASDNRLSRRQIAMAVGLSAGNVTRRLRKMLRRLHHPIVKALASPAAIDALTPQQRGIGLDYFLRASTISNLAGKYRLTQDQVRSTLQYIRGWQVGRENR